MVTTTVYENWAEDESYVTIQLTDCKFTKNIKTYEPGKGEVGEDVPVTDVTEDMTFEEGVLWAVGTGKDYVVHDLLDDYIAQRDGYNDAQAKKDALRADAVRKRAIAKAEAKLAQLKAEM